jgi:two-component system, chemotaxis family, chemotaxis protein CheY
VKKLKVLIVDDSSVLRKIVERALREAGLDIAEVLEASKVRKPLAKFRKVRSTSSSATSICRLWTAWSF